MKSNEYINIMEKLDMDDIFVIRVNKTEFELNDGRIYQHPIELDEEPILEEFNEWYKNSKQTMKELIKKVHEEKISEVMDKHEPTDIDN